MTKYYGTFYENEGEIIWVNVHYQLDPYHHHRDEEAEMWHLTVHHYQSGDITEYIPENWMEMFDKMARINDKEDKEYFDKWHEQTSDYHEGKIAAQLIVKMMQVRYDDKRIIEELAKTLDNYHTMLHNKLQWAAPPQILIDANNLSIEQLQQLIDIKKEKQ